MLFLERNYALVGEKDGHPRLRLVFRILETLLICEVSICKESAQMRGIVIATGYPRNKNVST